MPELLENCEGLQWIVESRIRAAVPMPETPFRVLHWFDSIVRLGPMNLGALLCHVVFMVWYLLLCAVGVLLPHVQRV